MYLTHATGATTLITTTITTTAIIKATRRKRLAQIQEMQLKKLSMSSNYLPTVFKTLF